LRGHRKRLDRHGGAAAPDGAELQAVLGRSKRLLHRAPGEVAVQDHVRAVRLMDERAPRLHRLLGIHDVRQRLVVDLDQLGRVLGERPAVGDHGGHPLSGIAHAILGERPTRHLGRVHADRERVGGGAEFLAGQHVVDARGAARRIRVDGADTGRRIGRGHDRDVLQAGKSDIGRVAAAPGDEARIFLRASLSADVTEAVRALALGHYFAPARRLAASCTASTICW
jgi:hypothetical protein